MSEGKTAESAVRRFSGEGANPQKDYKQWRRWARAYLTVQKARGVKEEALGSLLFTLLDGAALRAFDSHGMDELEQPGGQDVIYQILDERFPEETTQDRIGEVLDNIFELKVEKHESTAAYTGRVRAAFTAAEAEGVKFPPIARGYLLLRFARLPPERKAIVMAAARQSYLEADIASAMRTTYPEGLFTGKHSNVNQVEVPADVDLAEYDDMLEEGDVMLAEGLPDLTGDDVLEEQDAIDVLLSWKQTRANITKEKLSRGLANNSRDLKRIEARVRCFKCKQVGHFSRNCPAQKKQAKGNAGTGTTSSGSKVSFVMMARCSGACCEDEDQHVAALVETWSQTPRDFWREEDNMVIREHVIPRSSFYSPVFARCPCSVQELSSARKTVMIREDGSSEEFFTPNWRNRTESNKPTKTTWTGKTIFYKLKSHQAHEDDETEDEAAFVNAIDELTLAYQVAVHDACLEPDSEEEIEETESFVALVHQAGHGVVDTGCGRGLVGEATLKKHQEAMKRFDLEVEELPSRPHVFRYGNGTSDTSIRRVQIPVYLGGKVLRMRVHVVPGEVPLLISKRFLKSLGATLDLGDNQVHFKKVGICTEMLEKKDGSYQLNLLDMKGPNRVESVEVDFIPDAATTKVNMVKDEGSVAVAESDEETEELEGQWCVFKSKERLDLQKQVTEVLRTTMDDGPKIVEVFSPGRFAEACEKFGIKCPASFDVSDGWDWGKIAHRRRAEEVIDIIDPDVLLLCPPCGPLSKLQNLTPMDKRIDPEGFERDQRRAALMVAWCVELALKRLRRGKHYVFEAGQGCHTWKLPCMERLRQASMHDQVDVPACAVGLKDRSSGLLFGKKWRFVTSNPTIALVLSRFKCDGKHEHQTVEGSSGGQLRSVQSQVYPPKLVNAILGAIAMSESHETACMAISQQSVQMDGPLNRESRQKVETAIRKMHVNLGHASSEDMLRILRHHRASSQVLDLVRAFECDLCKARQMPKAVRHSAPPRDLAPLRYIGLDVKWLPSWKKDFKLKAVNIVCRGSGLQQVFPFRETETTEVIARLYRQWTRAFGRPRFLKFDASKCNLGQHFLDLLERDGTTPIDIPGEAHHQMGDIESQGGHFETCLIKVIDEMGPTNYEQWLECVDLTVEARNSLMRRGGYSPNQLVFGRDPECPGDDLLTDDPNPIANGAIIEDAIARFSHDTRQSARRAVLESMDHRAARIALNSRPRPLREYRPDITMEDQPPGELLAEGPTSLPDCRPSTQALPRIAEETPTEQPAQARSESGSVSGSGSTISSQMSNMSSLQDRLQHMSPSEQAMWEASASRASQLDGHGMRRPSNASLQSTESKRMRVEPQQQIGGVMYPPPMPPPPIPVTVHDSGSERMMRSESERPPSDEIQNFVLWCDETHSLLTSGRKEISLKDPKWATGDGYQKVVEGWKKEFNNVVHEKQALRPLSMEESRRIRQQCPDRIVPSRVVLVEKDQEDGTMVVKARWTARGDKDPDLLQLVRSGQTQAPTISANGRFLVMQVIASMRFVLQLGDVTGAFLESDQMDRETGSLYMDAPHVPLPEVEVGQLFQVEKPMYGFNDAPQKWFRKFKNTATGLRWRQSRLDPCVFFLLWSSTDETQLIGIMGVHVDDVLLGGSGDEFDQSVNTLRSKFPFRKWKHHAGMFCGSELSQNPETFEITVSQEAFAEKLQKPKLRMKEDPCLEITPEEASSLKSTLGGALWLAKETRPDLAVQVSQGQQLLPKPTLGEARTVSNVVRRAKQYKHLTWKILSIPMNELRIVLHTDAAFANAKKQGTQAGYLVGMTNANLQQGKPAPWAPALWKSYRLKRVVGSTFAGESQVLMDGLGHAEWIACFLAEAKHHDFSLAEREKFFEHLGLQAIVDCKSIYDHLQQYTSPSSVGDKRVAIDLVIIRETLQRLHGSVRWAPTWLQLADALTKESPEAMDILRAAMVTNQYHLHEESINMQAAAEQRQQRVNRKPKVSTAPASSQATQVCLVTSRSQQTMVKVSTSQLSEEEIRALFEVMVSESVKNSEEFDANTMQSKSMAKIKLKAEAINSRLFRAQENMITLTYTKSTKMIAITGGATFLDGVQETLDKVLKVYAAFLKDQDIQPLPEGCEVWGRAMKWLMQNGVSSHFLQDAGDGPENQVKNEPDQQVFTPVDAAFEAAVADLMNEGARKLHDFPLWRNKFVALMVREFNGSHEQAMEITEMTAKLEQAMHEDTEEWGMIQEAVPKAKAKASSRGYRG
eukprot:Skav229155  [mRNA]  locus=scaffold2275:264912:272030:- [translate_table: standard]